MAETDENYEASDFFEDLKNELLQRFPEQDDKIDSAIDSVRALWESASVYITRDNNRDERIYRMRNEYTKLKLEFCRRHGISLNRLREITRGRTPGKESAQNNLL
jgi:hypothetical protein